MLILLVEVVLLSRLGDIISSSCYLFYQEHVRKIETKSDESVAIDNDVIISD